MDKDPAAKPPPPSSITGLLPSFEPEKKPLPFTWKCHACLRTQRLSLGQRCLRCSHKMCSTLPPPHLGTTTTRGGGVRKRKLAPRRQTRVCTTSFDYDGWLAQNVFRRALTKYNSDPDKYGRRYAAWMDKWERGDLMDQFDVETRWENSLARDETRRLARIKTRQGVCDIDCDYPGECLRVRLAARDDPMEDQVEDRSTDSEEDCSQQSSGEHEGEENEDEAAQDCHGEEGEDGAEEGFDEDDGTQSSDVEEGGEGE